MRREVVGQGGLGAQPEVVTWNRARRSTRTAVGGNKTETELSWQVSYADEESCTDSGVVGEQ